MACNLLRSLRPQPCIGLDLAPPHLRLALVRRRGRLREVLRLAQVALPDGLLQEGQITDLDALAQACRRLLEPLHQPQAPLVLAMPGSCLAIRRLMLPAGASDWERLAQVRAEMAAYGLPATDYVLDYRIAAPAAGRKAVTDLTVWAWAASSLAVEDRLALAAALNRPLAALPPEDDCLSAFLRQTATACGDALLHLERNGCWLAHGDAPAQRLRWHPAVPDLAALLAETAPLLRPRPQRLLLDCALARLPAPHTLSSLCTAFARYAGLRALPAPLPTSLLLKPSEALPAGAALASFHRALALAWRGLA